MKVLVRRHLERRDDEESDGLGGDERRLRHPVDTHGREARRGKRFVEQASAMSPKCRGSRGSRPVQESGSLPPSLLRHRIQQKV